jgi:hypothetical protein
VARLIEQHGSDGKIVDLLTELKADCPKHLARNMSDIAAKLKVMPPSADPCAAATVHWSSTEALGTAAAFEDHLARFPNCAFAGLAKLRLNEIKKNQAATVVPPPHPRRR